MHMSFSQINRYLKVTAYVLLQSAELSYTGLLDYKYGYFMIRQKFTVQVLKAYVTIAMLQTLTVKATLSSIV